MGQDRIVACMKWGDAFAPDYVNVLFGAVCDNLSGDFTFVCITDNAEGLHPGIAVMPIPELNLPDHMWSAGAWPKVSLLMDGLFPPSSRVLFLDLDLMVTDSLDIFFEPSDGFHVIGQDGWGHDPSVGKLSLATFFGRKPNADEKARTPRVVAGKAIQPNIINTSVFAFDAGAHHFVYERLFDDLELAVDAFDNEQHFIEHHLETWHAWPKGVVDSYKFSLRRPILVDIFMRPLSPRPGTHILAFHGRPRPMDFATKRMSSARELPHVWFGPVPWFRAYWDRYNRAE